MASASSSSRPRLVLATLNEAKGRELARLLGDVAFDLVSLRDVPGATAPEETEATYAGNALIKARAAARLASAIALGDDSGVEVDALGGAPGVLSARFGGPGRTDGERVRLLLDSLEGVPRERRGARFRCVIAVVDPSGQERLAEGTAEGMIAEAPRGSGGFGYDPVFLYPPLGRTFAQLTAEERWRVSHRAIAARAARRLLLECYTPTPAVDSGCGAAW